DAGPGSLAAATEPAAAGRRYASHQFALKGPAAGGDHVSAGGRLTFHGNDPGAGAAAAVCTSTPTQCPARTRVYRSGTLAAEGFPVADISDYLDVDDGSVVWLDLHDPDEKDLEVLSEEFGLHPLAVEDAEHEHERTKLDRYQGYLFLTAYAVHL